MLGTTPSGLTGLTEIIQYSFRLGLGEVADIIINGLGMALGVLLVNMLMQFGLLKEYIEPPIR